MTETLNLAKQLIACPSVTPDDQGCQTIISDRLKQLEFSLEWFQIEGVTNLWARLGTESPLFVFAGHTDVVPTGDLAQWQFPPFQPTEHNGCLYGRGAVDMKGALAAMVTACERFLHNKSATSLTGSIAFLITSDEEGPSIHGTQAVLARLKQRNEIPTWCLIGEPSSESVLGDVVKVGRRGSLTGTLTIIGKQGHVAYPQLAINPIHQAMQSLHHLLTLQWPVENQLFPPTSLQFANIQSGTGAANVIPGELTAQFNIRYAPPLTSEQLKADIVRCFEKSKLNYQLTWHESGKPFYTSPDCDFMQTVLGAIESTLGRSATCSTSGGTSDGRFFAPLGTQVIELGLVNATIHQVNEHTKIEDLATLSRLYETILKQLLSA